MALTPGTRLGVYEVTAQIGVGGMGEVYRATDTKLKRQVALKILPPSLAADADRLARFQREAEVLASLNHPHIAALYGLEESAGMTALVMELVEGEDVSQRIARGAIALDEALPIAKQIAEALEAAHEQGIIHRDLKPADIKVRADGTVKVLDFGLAKAMEPTGAGRVDAANSPTMTSPAAMTQAGMILGTAAYMAPEQATGKPVDQRADIWAFGVVLYEIVTGQRLFQGDNVADILAAVIKAEPDLRAVPSSLRLLVQRCLEKDPKNRLRDIGDYRELLRPEAGAPVSTRSSSKVAWVLTAIAATIAAAVSTLHLRQPPPTVWAGSMLGLGDMSISIPRLSPDGTLLAFIAVADGLYLEVGVMKPETGDRVILTHQAVSGYAYSLSWSPDGSRIYYDRYVGLQPLGIFSVPALGGDEHLVLENAGRPDALPDGSLMVMRLNDHRQQQVFRFWPDTGRLQSFPLQLGGVGDRRPIQHLPGGHEVIVFGSAIGAEGSSGTAPGTSLHLLNLDTAAVRKLSLGSLPDSAVWGFTIRHDGQAVLVVSYDGKAQTIVEVPLSGGGSPRALFSMNEWPEALDTSTDGNLYVSQVSTRFRIFRFDPETWQAETVRTFSNLNTNLFGILGDGRPVVDLSINGRRRLMVVEDGKPPVPLANTQEETSMPATSLGANEAVFLLGPEPWNKIAIVDVPSGRIIRTILFDHGAIGSLAGSADGKTIYCAAGGAIWAIPASGAGEPQRLHSGDAVATDPNGRFLIVGMQEFPVSRLVRVSLEGGPDEEIPHRRDIEPVETLGPSAVSRDGRILAVLGSPTFAFSAGITDIAGHYRQISREPTWDFQSVGWTPNGKAMGLAREYDRTIWKYTPQSEAK